MSAAVPGVVEENQYLVTGGVVPAKEDFQMIGVLFLKRDGKPLLLMHFQFKRA